MHHAELLIVTITLGVLFAVIIYVGVVAVRKQQLLRRPGGLPMALKTGPDKWLLGVGRYQADHLLWYTALGLGRRPSRDLSRATLEVTGQRGRRREENVLPADIVIVECLADGDRVSLGLSAAAVTGFLSWLESAAPHW